MMAEISKKVIYLLTGLFLTLFAFNSKVLAAYSDSNVVSDYTFTNTSTMSAQNIEDFLCDPTHNVDQQGPSWLCGYSYTIPSTINIPYPTSPDGVNIVMQNVNADQSYVSQGQQINLYDKKVSKLIYDESQQHGINPQVILAMLQKESGSITNWSRLDLNNGHNGYSSASVFNANHPTPTAWPLFYTYDEDMGGCLNGDASRCTAYYPNGTLKDYRQISYDYGGVGQQIAYAAFSLQKNYNIFLANPNLNGSTFCNGNPCANAATRDLYNYTPHAQTSFYSVFNNWFGDPTYVPPAPDAPVSQRIIPGDANEDQHVNSTDLSILAGTWGQTVAANTGADFSGDEVINSTDLSILAGNWGR